MKAVGQNCDFQIDNAAGYGIGRKFFQQGPVGFTV